MKLHIVKARTVSLLILLLGNITPLTWAQPLVSNFNTSIEGWTVETHSDPAGSFSFIGSFTPDFAPSGGHPGGYITEVDPDNNWSFFRAPLSWSGDRSSFAQGWLHYSTRTDSDSFPDGRIVILVGNGGQTISSDQGIPELDTWTDRRIGLNNQSNEWFDGTSGDGVFASETLVNMILTDLEAVFIGLEFGSEQLEERVDLDSVSMSDCRADLNGDGQLDFFDISQFLSEMPDYNGDSQFDFFDVSAFLTDFSIGCP